MKDKAKKWLPWGAGFVIGILNGLLGAGGGMVAVPTLRACGVEGKRSHATSLAVMVPLSLVSAWLYLSAERLELSAALPYLPGGLAGALAGAWLLRRIDTLLLRRVFGVLLIYSAVRLLR